MQLRVPSCMTRTCWHVVSAVEHWHRNEPMMVGVTRGDVPEFTVEVGTPTPGRGVAAQCACEVAARADLGRPAQPRNRHRGEPVTVGVAGGAVPKLTGLVEPPASRGAVV